MRIQLLIAAVAATFRLESAVPAADAVGECFQCDQMWSGLYYHEDINIGSKLKGTSHPSWVLGSCADALGIWHTNYGNATLRKDELPELLERGTDEQILKFILEHSEFKLNTRRSALQGFSESGDLVRHVVLSPSLVNRIQPILTEIAHERLL